jgi:hypothetical protein
MKKMLLVILMCCIAFGCGKPAAEVPKLEVKVDGQDNSGKLEAVQKMRLGTKVLIGLGTWVGLVSLFVAGAIIYVCRHGTSDYVRKHGTGGEEKTKPIEPCTR